MPRPPKGGDELHMVVKDIISDVCKSEHFINQLASIIADKIDNQLKEIKELKKKYDEISDRQEKLDQCLRNKNIRIYGLPETNMENCINTVLNFLKGKMNLQVPEQYIEFCYRIGQKEATRCRPIMVGFSSGYYKKLIYSNKKQLKNTRIVIREDLTNKQLEIVKICRRNIGAGGKVWTNNGQVFVQQTGESVKKIKCVEDADSLAV